MTTPDTYDLRTDRDIVQLPPLPEFGQAGTDVVDPSFKTRIRRLTDETTAADGSGWGTSSGPNLCDWSADGSLLKVTGDNGGLLILSAADFSVVRDDLYCFTESTFARVPSKPSTLYVPHYSYTVTALDARTGERKTLITLTDEVGPMSQDSGQYLSACYSSAGHERIALAYGAQQETHPYVTVFDADDPTQRITLNVQTSELRVNGCDWAPLLNHDGTPANLAHGIHSVAIDRSGRWVQIDISGNAFFCVFDVDSQRLYQWAQDGNGGASFGHYAFGYQQRINGIADPGGGGMMQWLLHDLANPATPMPFRPLIVPPVEPSDHSMSEHCTFNNAQPDRAVPFASGTQRSADAGAWNCLHDELVAVATDPNAPHPFYRIAHHRCDYVAFRDSPRPQISPDGRRLLFTSNWGGTLGTYGGENRRDAFVVDLAQTDTAPVCTCHPDPCCPVHGEN